MEKKQEHQTHYYKESDIKDAIIQVAASDLSPSLKSLLIHSLKCCISISSLIQKNRLLRRVIGRFFGFTPDPIKPRKKKPDPPPPGDKGKGGTGRTGAGDIEGALTVKHPHPSLKSGDPCPEDDCTGKVYPLKNPGIYVRISANKPLTTTVHYSEKFRCGLCEKVFNAIPEDIKNAPKYDQSVLAHIVMQKCFYGVSFGRDAALGGLSSSLRSELFKEADHLLRPIFDLALARMINEAVVGFDDTKIKIQPKSKGGSKSAWASCFISETVVIHDFSREHGGIGLKEFLKLRHLCRSPLVAMSDALGSYTSYKEGCVDAHCLVHARRRFVVDREDDEIFCDKIIGIIEKIYKIESQAQDLSPKERLELHQKKSGSLLNTLMEEVQGAIEQERFLPNSNLSRALNYVASDFNKLTVFMRMEGVPLDTNYVERAIKAPIRLRKQAPIFKTVPGAARTGRLLSLVETSLRLGLDPLSYLCWAIEGARKGLAALELTPWYYSIVQERSLKGIRDETCEL